MKDPESKTVFAGVDGRTDTELPDWYRQKKAVNDLESFAEVVRDLPQYNTDRVCGYCSYDCYFSHRHRNRLEELAGEQSMYFPPA